MTITILSIIAVASLLLNVAQWYERKNERKENEAEREAEREKANRYIAELAKKEVALDEMTDKYNNEVQHREWAIGRIKDQQSVINQLERGITPKKRQYKGRKDGE